LFHAELLTMVTALVTRITRSKWVFASRERLYVIRTTASRAAGRKQRPLNIHNPRRLNIHWLELLLLAFSILTQGCTNTFTCQ